MNNRDYFKTPIQGARTQHDYGRTGPLAPMGAESNGGAALLMILASAFGGLVLALMFFAWIG